MRQAFSLVELSIVLVILGLLTGGILAGQSLIRAAELRSVTTDVQRYLAATKAFRDKYFALPGDMTNATAFWGSLGGTGSDTVCQALAATGTATCNGDGDGSFLTVIGGTTYTTYERMRFWQHLANAGLIEGQYSGVGGAPWTAGTNVPPSKLSGAYWAVSTGFGFTAEGGTTYYAGDTIKFAADYGKTTLLLNTVAGSTSTAGSYPLKPEEAWNIDTKMDDGNPMTGFIMPVKGDGTNTFCTTNAGTAPPGDAGSTYKLSNTNKDCMIYFLRQL